MGFSVLMSVYSKANPVFLIEALNSIVNQTLIPSEIVLVKDGPLTKHLDSTITEYTFSNPGLFKIIDLSRNSGLGIALNEGLKHCTFDLIARMDTDDICYPERFEKQVKYLSENISTSVLGSAMQEFNEKIGDLNRYRKLPTDKSIIYRFSKYRNPLNHPTVMFRKSHVLSVKSYQDMPLFEDYYLWIRMIIAGFEIANLQEPLLHFRTGNDMIGRRHGFSYLKKEFNFLIAVKKLGFINNKEFLISLNTKLPLRLLPKFLLKAVYKVLLR